METIRDRRCAVLSGERVGRCTFNARRQLVARGAAIDVDRLFKSLFAAGQICRAPALAATRNEGDAGFVFHDHGNSTKLRPEGTHSSEGQLKV